MYDNLILKVKNFYSVLVIFSSLIFHLQWHTFELASEPM